MAKIDNTQKNIIYENWQQSFPSLTAFTKDKFYRVVGCIVMGLELVKLPRENVYRPYFVIYSLCGNREGLDFKSCLSTPILLKEFYNSKKLQYKLSYESLSTDIFESVRTQSPLRFEGDISLDELISVIDQYSKTSALGLAPNSFLQGMLQEAKLRIALFVNLKEAQRLLEEINEKNWNSNQFKAWNVEIDAWLFSLKELVSKRDELLEVVKVNKQNKKIAMLKHSNLV